MATYRSFKDLDWAMLFLTICLCLIGVLQIYSVTHATPAWKDAWWKQIIFLISGLLLMWLITLVDYHTLLGQTPVFYAITLFMLVATFVIGKRVLGAGRWIPLPLGLHFQVSEFAKLVVVLLVARYLTELKKDTVEFWDVIRMIGLVGLPMVLVMKQPDLGTSLTYLPPLIIGIFLAGLRWQYIAGFLLLVGVASPLGYMMMRPYQKARLEVFLNPNLDPQGEGYQIIQSKIAVGQGGMWGRGATQGTQTQLKFLPVPHTDFIFSTFAEEHGFVGVVVTLGLYFLLLMQIVQNAQTAPDRAGMYLCMGVASVILLHVLVNVGMVVGQMPVTGIPLPLLSYGGSSIWSMFLMLGLVNNVRLRRFVN